MEPAPLERPTRAAAPDHAAWGARFGWIVGGVLGLLAGFAATFELETHVLVHRVAHPTAMASRLSSVLVPALFVVGALAGYSFGARSGSARYKSLGVAAGISLLTLAWCALALSR